MDRYAALRHKPIDREHGQMCWPAAPGTLHFIAIAIAHSDNQITCRIALMLFGTVSPFRFY